MTLASLSIEDAFAKEGEALEFTVRLSAPVEEPVRVRWQAAGISANESVDFHSGQEGTIEIAAGETSSTLSVPTLADDEEEMPESSEGAFVRPVDGVPGGRENWFERIQTVSGLAGLRNHLGQSGQGARHSLFSDPRVRERSGFARVVITAPIRERFRSMPLTMPDDTAERLRWRSGRAGLSTSTPTI